MGIASIKKFIRNNAGILTEEAALTTTVGVADADRVPALNAAGILDDSIINASAAPLANRVVKMTGAGVIAPTVLNAVAASAGAGDASRIVQLDGSGRISSTMMPVGVGADTASIVASESLAAGDFVNIWNNASVANIRKADAATSGKEAHGFVLAAVSNGVAGTVHFEGTNTAVTGRTPGLQFLSVTAGLTSAVAPTGPGNVVQRVGYATSATAINFDGGDPIVLA